MLIEYKEICSFHNKMVKKNKGFLKTIIEVYFYKSIL